MRVGGVVRISGCDSLRRVVIDSPNAVVTDWSLCDCPLLKEVVFTGRFAGSVASSGLLETTDAIYYPAVYSKLWERMLVNIGYGGRFGAFEGNWSGSNTVVQSARCDYGKSDVAVVTNFVYVHTTVTNVVEYSTTVTNVVEYVPAPGTSPSATYAVKAGGQAAQIVAGAAGWDALGLPEGMSWDAETGMLGGTPVKSGVYDLILVSGSGAETRMMRTTIAVVGFDPIVGYVGTDFVWTGAPMTLLADYKNLPAGLKWSAANGTLTGVPTKAGDFSRETVHGDAVSFAIEDLPASAVGTFNGQVSLGGTNYPLVVTATKAGKLTAKLVVGTKTLSLTAPSWSGWSCEEEKRLLFRAKVQTKTDAIDLVLDTSAPWNAQQLSAAVTLGTLSGATGTAQRNPFGKVGQVWECSEAHDLALSFVGTYTFDAEQTEQGYWQLVIPPAGKVGALKVIVKDTGAVSISGKLNGVSYSSSATLRSDGRIDFFVKGVQVSGTM